MSQLPHERPLLRALEFTRFLGACAFLLLACGTLATCTTPRSNPSGVHARPPNVVIVLLDDLGWGDLGCYGGAAKTPAIDSLALGGLRFTDFSAAQASCTPSRAGLLTGCYPNRIGLTHPLSPLEKIGLAPEEETLPELLKEQGYATALIGKWHLGVRPGHSPLDHGFDEYLGLLVSNDYWPVDYDGKPLEPGQPRSHWPFQRLVDGRAPGAELRTLDDQSKVNELLVRRSVDFVERHAHEPFFLVLATPMPHVPLAPGAPFRGRSGGGLYGDVLLELDASVGRVVETLERHGLREDTLIVVTSDNGPWLNLGDHAGSAGGLREGKGSVWEGGLRVPCIVSWPGVVPAGTEYAGHCTNLDLLPTIAGFAGARAPKAKSDGVSFRSVFEGDLSARPRAEFLCFEGNALQAVRRGRWKLQLPHEYRSYAAGEPRNGGWPGPTKQVPIGTQLFDLDRDPFERVDVAAEHREIVAELEALARAARAEFGDAKAPGPGVRPPLAVE